MIISGRSLLFRADEIKMRQDYPFKKGMLVGIGFHYVEDNYDPLDLEGDFAYASLVIGPEIEEDGVISVGGGSASFNSSDCLISISINDVPATLKVAMPERMDFTNVIKMTHCMPNDLVDSIRDRAFEALVAYFAGCDISVVISKIPDSSSEFPFEISFIFKRYDVERHRFDFKIPADDVDSLEEITQFLKTVIEVV